MLVVNLPPYDDALADLTDATDLPVLQDDSDVDMSGGWGAAKGYVYVLDPEGLPRFIHYSINFDSERERLVAEVLLLLEEGR